jgi:hypothetical protein
MLLLKFNHHDPEIGNRDIVETPAGASFNEDALVFLHEHLFVIGFNHGFPFQHKKEDIVGIDVFSDLPAWFQGKVDNFDTG